MSNEEATARIKINKLLEAVGWRFFQEGDASANIRLEPGVTIKSSDLDALGTNFEKSSKGFPLHVREATLARIWGEAAPAVSPAALTLAQRP